MAATGAGLDRFLFLDGIHQPVRGIRVIQVKYTGLG